MAQRDAPGSGNPNDEFPLLPSQAAQNPWTRHYGLEGLEPPLNDAESWIAPRLPALTAAVTGTITHPANGIAHDLAKKPSDEELDVLFTSERLQLSRFAGLTTAEAQAYASCSVSPGALQSQFTQGNWFEKAFGCRMITQTYSVWLSVFRNERWKAFSKPMRETIEDYRGGHGGDVWHHPNNVRLRDALGPSIQMANLVLREACKGQW